MCARRVRRAPGRARSARGIRRLGGVFSLVSFLAGGKKDTRPRCGEPQLGFEIARKARDTIQDLDSRFRGNDRKPKAAHQAAFVSSGGLRRFAPNPPYI